LKKEHLEKNQHRCKLVSVGALKQLSSDQFTLAILFENMGMKSYSSYMGIFHRFFSEFSHRYHFHGGLERHWKGKLVEHMILGIDC